MYLRAPQYESLHSKKTSAIRTVRTTFAVFASSMLLLGLASVVSQDATYITIVASPTAVKKGEPFTMTVVATAHTPINAVDIQITYPEDRMKIESIDTGVSVITLWTKQPYAQDGVVYLTGGVYQRGFVGEHTIARIKARATESGVTQVSARNIRLIAGDGKGTEVPAMLDTQSVTQVTVEGAEQSLKGVASIEIITDIDGDGEVTLADVSSFMAAWFTKGKLFDFNNDGKMTFRDFSILLSDSFFK